MKSYTDLEQSKKLGEILPIESADMYWMNGKINNVKLLTPNIIGNNHDEPLWNDWDVPCWSLVALLGVLPNGIVINKDAKNAKYHFSSTHIGTYVTTDEPINACYEIIIKLHELNLL